MKVYPPNYIFWVSIFVFTDNPHEYKGHRNFILINLHTYDTIQHTYCDTLFKSTDKNEKNIYVQLLLHEISLFKHHISIVHYALFGPGLLMKAEYRKCSYGPYFYFYSILNWCVHLSRIKVSVSYFNYLETLTPDEQKIPEGTCSQVLRSTLVDSECFESLKQIRVKIN